ncbi:MAG: hypothetical protein LBM68_03905 [Bacteroidales bacterium]|jgi:hypothetical protein|nr:hypothetical protein [Bacteroidales bacterium]
MKIMYRYFLIWLCAVTSCQSSNESIFKAVKYDTGKSLAIEIYSDYSYILTVNDTIFEEGRAQFNDQQVLLTPKTNNSFITLLRHREFEIADNQLCNVMYTPQNTDSTRQTLVLPIKAIDDKECYEIIRLQYLNK